MSNQTYDELWCRTQKELEDLAVRDYETQTLEPEFEKSIIQRQAFELYLKYILAANKLEEIYDQMLQPQKRLLIRKVLDSCLGRVIELKHDLVNIDMMEFSYNDRVMNEMRLTPSDIELMIPRYFRRENKQDTDEKNRFIDKILIKLGWLEKEMVEVKMTELQAIRIIQMHERARQGRLR